MAVTACEIGRQLSITVHCILNLVHCGQGANYSWITIDRFRHETGDFQPAAGLMQLETTWHRFAIGSDRACNVLYLTGSSPDTAKSACIPYHANSMSANNRTMSSAKMQPTPTIMHFHSTCSAILPAISATRLAGQPFISEIVNISCASTTVYSACVLRKLSASLQNSTCPLP